MCVCVSVCVCVRVTLAISSKVFIVCLMFHYMMLCVFIMSEFYCVQDGWYYIVDSVT